MGCCGSLGILVSVRLRLHERHFGNGEYLSSPTVCLVIFFVFSFLFFEGLVVLLRLFAGLLTDVMF